MTDDEILLPLLAHYRKLSIWLPVSEIALRTKLPCSIVKRRLERLAAAGKIPPAVKRKQHNNNVRTKRAYARAVAAATVALMSEAEWAAKMAATGRDYGKRWAPRQTVSA